MHRHKRRHKHHGNRSKVAPEIPGESEVRPIARIHSNIAGGMIHIGGAWGRVALG